ncbi:UNVERIFIED_CONTAM: hypothetical protein Slati_1343100 [Sesamum latifolium]|uniref:Reverse transcriptase domain-containing protein n=1 Tax=Sesamum latifolium TaxID=2727402 RepID=A0AAW2XIZ7_9LAMI
MSPYLFVLVMEAFRLTVKARIQQDTSFSYHWKCKEIPFTILCFADDLLMFCKADFESIRVYKEALDEFVGLPGLHVNAHKSHIIVSRAASANQQHLASQLGFQVGSLPLKYLGVPLVSSKQESSSLRLCSLQCFVLGKDILLPSTIIEGIERIFRHFLWRGSNSRGYAKVAWAQVCLPKAQSGQGLQRIGAVNKSLMAKHLWDIIS